MRSTLHLGGPLKKGEVCAALFEYLAQEFLYDLRLCDVDFECGLYLNLGVCY